MSWETAIDTLRNRKLGQIASEMKQAGMVPIVLRWNAALKTSQNVYGFYGAKTSVGETMDGRQEVNGTIDPNSIVTFFRDEYNFGYALVPRCDRNMDVLAATHGEKGLPWTIEDPQVAEEVKVLAEKMKPAKEAVKAIKEDVKSKGSKTLAEVAAA
jgi:hypothetical protein